jgi:hypothetical protein
VVDHRSVDNKNFGTACHDNRYRVEIVEIVEIPYRLFFAVDRLALFCQ